MNAVETHGAAAHLNAVAAALAQFGKLVRMPGENFSFGQGLAQRAHISA